MFEHIKQCKNCELHKKRFQVVLGKGNLKAKILLIGEAPGKNENVIGDPFVGLAGTKLDELLEKVNLKRDDIFIMNSCFCWTGDGNPDPTEEQLQACFPHVLEILEYIKPEYVMPMGNIALATITGRIKISSHRGRFVKPRAELAHLGFKVYPTFHPASMLHNHMNKSFILEDLSNLVSIAYPKDYPLEYYLVDNRNVFDTMCSEVLDSPLVAVDVETTGLNLISDNIIGISFCCEDEKAYYIPTLVRESDDKKASLVPYWGKLDHRYMLSGMQEILTHKEIQKTGQNFTFDRKFIAKDFRYVLCCSTDR